MIFGKIFVYCASDESSLSIARVMRETGFFMLFLTLCFTPLFFQLSDHEMLVLKVNQLKKDLEWRTMALHADKEVLERLGSSNQHRGSYGYFSNTHNTSNAEATLANTK